MARRPPEPIAPPPAAGDRRGRLWAWSLALAVLAALPFVPSLWNGFVNWDDKSNLVDNVRFRGLGPDQLAWMFTTFHKGHYQPLTWLTFGLNWVVGGLAPVGYHLLNVLLHAANVVLLWRVLLELCRGAATTARATWLWAGAAALLFGVHPLRVESVAWATERRDVLSGLFWLGTLWLYLRAVRTEGPARVRLLRAALCLYLLSLLSKAWGITLPVVLLILDWFPLRRLRRETARAVLLEKLPFAALAAVFAILAIVAQAVAGAAVTLRDHGPLDRVAQAGYGLCFYLGKLLAPVRLSPLYPLDDAIAWTNPVFPLALALAAAVTVAAWRLRARAPWWLATWLAYVVIVSPVLGLTQSGGQLAADRYTYLASIPVVALVGTGLARVPRPRVAGVVVAVVLVALGALSWRQCAVWRDSVTLWEHVLTLHPDSHTAHYNLGCAYDEERGDAGPAVRHWRRALELRPRDQTPRHNLALRLAGVGRYADAIREWEIMLEVEPRHAEALYSVGLAHVRLGRLPAAEPWFRRAVDSRPDYADAWHNLGDVLAAAGRRAEARDCFERVLAIEPGNQAVRKRIQQLDAGGR